MGKVQMVSPLIEATTGLVRGCLAEAGAPISEEQATLFRTLRMIRIQVALMEIELKLWNGEASVDEGNRQSLALLQEAGDIVREGAVLQ